MPHPNHDEPCRTPVPAAAATAASRKQGTDARRIELLVLAVLALAAGACGGAVSRAAGAPSGASHAPGVPPTTESGGGADQGNQAGVAATATADGAATARARPHAKAPADFRILQVSAVQNATASAATGEAPRRGIAASPTAFRFVQLSDPQMGMTDSLETDRRFFDLAVSKLNALDPPAAFVINTGDMVQDGSSSTQWADYFRVAAKIAVPHHEVMGNHDGWSEDGLARWRTVFGKKDYYSFNSNRCVFIGLNSYFFKHPDELPEEAAAQKSFLEDTLKANAASPCKFLFFHSPIFVKTAEEPEERWNLPMAERSYLFSIIEAHGITAVLSGHYHRIVIASHRGTQLITCGPTAVPQGKNSDRTLSRRGFMVYDFDPDTGRLDYQYVLLQRGELPP